MAKGEEKVSLRELISGKKRQSHEVKRLAVFLPPQVYEKLEEKFPDSPVTRVVQILLFAAILKAELLENNLSNDDIEIIKEWLSQVEEARRNRNS